MVKAAVIFPHLHFFEMEGTGGHPLRLRICMVSESGEHEVLDQAKQLKDLIDVMKTAVIVRAEEQFDVLVRAIERGHGADVECVNCLAHLVDYMAETFRENEKNLQHFAREGGGLTAIQELTKTCNIRGDMILDQYLKCTNVGYLEGSEKTGRLHLEARDFDGYVPLLHEMASLILTCEEYRRFVTGVVIEQSGEEGRDEDAFSQLDPFSLSVDKVETLYTTLEKHLLADQVNAAISANTSLLEKAEYTFGWIGVSSERALSTERKGIVLAVLHHANHLLSHEYTGAVLAKRTSFEASAVPELNVFEISVQHLEMYMRQLWIDYRVVFGEDADLDEVMKDFTHTKEVFRKEEEIRNFHS